MNRRSSGGFRKGAIRNRQLLSSPGIVQFDLVGDETVPRKMLSASSPEKIGILHSCGVFHLAVRLRVLKARGKRFLSCACHLTSVFPLQQLNDEKRRREGRVASSQAVISPRKTAETVWGQEEVAVAGQRSLPVVCVLEVRQLPGMTEPKSQLTGYFWVENSLNFQSSQTEAFGKVPRTQWWKPEQKNERGGKETSRSCSLGCFRVFAFWLALQTSACASGTLSVRKKQLYT